MGINKRLYIHVGTHKTGTTSLQHYLYANRTKLSDAGISYPEIKIHEGAHHGLGSSLNRGLGLSVFNRKAIHSHISDLPVWQQLKMLIEKAPQSSILISTEEFEWLTKPEVIREYLGELDYRIIVYLRRQDSYLESFYQTLVKDSQRNDLPFSLWLNKVMKVWKIHDYQKLLSRWAEVFGKENMIVRVFENEAKQGLEKGFLRILELANDVVESCDIPEPVWGQKFRESIDVRCLEVVRLGNQVKTSQDQHKKLLREMVDLSTRLEKSGEINKCLATEQERERIMAAVKDSNLTLSRQYFGMGADVFNGYSSICADTKFTSQNSKLEIGR